MQKELLVGKKAIMDALDLALWASVIKLKRTERLPVAKIGGRWMSRRTLILRWIDRKLTAGEGGVDGCSEG